MRGILWLLILGCFSLWLTAEDSSAWQDLLQVGEKSPWRKVDSRWIFAPGVSLDPEKPTRLKVEPGTGSVWVNGDTGRVADLITKEEYGDCEVQLDFLLGKNSNSGIKFHALYEIQLRDTAGKPVEKLTGDDCGGIYPRAELLPRYRHIDTGIPPRVNAAKPAGEWQTLHVIFRSPRFDAAGKKIENARIVKAVLNGQVIHENQPLETPTGHNWSKAEKARGPFMLQADHGPVAFRNVKIRPISQ